MIRKGSPMVCFTLGLLACSGEDIVGTPSHGRESGFASASKISAHLDGKTLSMTGSGIPSHPNGYDEDVNLAERTQCYHRVVMSPVGGRYQVASEIGTLMNAPNPGMRGECDHETTSAELTFDSTAVLIENVRDGGRCFDFTVTYPGFGQEGRGSISEDGKTFVLELFFKDQATGHRCADGDVGAETITLSQTPFSGNAQQTYLISE